MEKGKKKEKNGRIGRFSSGGVVFRKVKGQEGEKVKVLWLVTKASPSKKFPKENWRLPKGWIDDKDGGKFPGPLASGVRRATKEELRSAAVKEVAEEGGVKVKVVEKIGTDKYFFIYEGKRILKFVTYFLMEYLGDTPEGFGFETEEVAWLSYKDARKRLTHTGEREILDKAAGIVSEI